MVILLRVLIELVGIRHLRANDKLEIDAFAAPPCSNRPLGVGKPQRPGRGPPAAARGCPEVGKLPQNSLARRGPLRGGPAPQLRRRRRRRSPATSLDAAVPVRRSIDGPTGRRRTARTDFRSDRARTSRNLAGTFGLGLPLISDAARGRFLQSLCEGSCPQIDAVAGPVDVT